MTSLVERVCEGQPDLHYAEFPSSKPTLLLLHGVTRDRRDWEPLLPELVRKWRVVALDHRGHGRSGRVPGEYRVIDYARDAARFVRDTFTEPICVMGHSLGAMVALWLAVDCPALVPCVVLEDPPFHTMGRRIGETPYRAQFAGMKEVLLRGGTIDEMTDGLTEIRVPTAQGTKRLGDLRNRASLRFSAECLVSVDVDVFVPLVEGRWLDGFDFEAMWSRVGCPVLLLQGDPAFGGAFTDADVETARRELPLCWHERFTGIGHQIHRSAPERVVDALGEFADFEGLR